MRFTGTGRSAAGPMGALIAACFAWMLALPAPALAATISITSERISISAPSLERSWTVEDGRLIPGPITNRLAQTELIGQAGSADFALVLEDADGNQRRFPSNELELVRATLGEQENSLRFEFAPFALAEPIVEDLPEEGGEGEEEQVSGEGGEELPADAEGEPEPPAAEPQPLWHVALVVVSDDDAGLMRSWIELSCDDPSQAAVVSLDSLPFVLGFGTGGLWHTEAPDSAEGIAVLGQPVFAEGLFLGAEFPASENTVADRVLRIRYWSGKTLERMAEDGQCSPEGVWTSRPCVIGAAPSTAADDVRSAFFSYIASLSRGPALRTVFSPYLENQLAEDADVLEEAFLVFDEAARAAGIEAPDAYATGDGWNNYDVPNVAEYTGEGENRTGFWEFNTKFPDALHPLSETASLLGSEAGLWLSPRGGRRFNAAFSALLEERGTGEVQRDEADYPSICTASRLYVERLGSLMAEWRDAYGIAYWALDGLASEPCSNASHSHMVGGPSGIFCTVDAWEAWCGLLETLRAEASAAGEDLWIDLDASCPPSPWMLLWADSLRMSGATSSSDAASASLVRDEALAGLVLGEGLCLPAWGLSGHGFDLGGLIQGGADAGALRSYLVSSALRGQSLMELSLPAADAGGDAALVLADACSLAREYRAASAGVRLVEAADGVLCWSGWDGDRGFLSFANTTDEAAAVELALDGALGIGDEAQGMAARRLDVLPEAGEMHIEQAWSAGDAFSVSLGPSETQTWAFRAPGGDAPELLTATVARDGSVTARFSERMSADASFLVDGAPAPAELMADGRSFRIEPGSADLADGAWHELACESAYGLFGSPIAEQAAIPIRSSGAIGNTVTGSWPASAEEGSRITVLDEGRGIAGTGGFSVSLGLATESASCTVAEQEGEWSLSIDADGQLLFRVGEAEVGSARTRTHVDAPARGTYGSFAYRPAELSSEELPPVNDGAQHLVVAQRLDDGDLRIYVDGELRASASAPSRALSGTAVSFGSDALAGQISDATVVNSALDRTTILSMSRDAASVPDDPDAPLPGGMERAAIAIALAAAFSAAIVAYQRIARAERS